MKYFCLFFSSVLFLHCQAPTPAPIVQNNAQPLSDNVRPQAPDWASQAVLYECNVRQFSPAGNFNGVRQQLPRLKDLGIDILWLMPIHPIGLEKRKEHPGDLGSPYSVQDYLAVNPDFGTLGDFKALVREAHELGLKIILDWVPNHTAWDAVWVKEHPEFYTRVAGQMTAPLNERGESMGWDDVADLDYRNVPLRRAMMAALQYWLRETDIDGYRVDMAGLVPNDFWAEVRPTLDSIKPVFMLAEWQDEPAHFKSAFQANYGWRWKDVTKDIWAGRQAPHALDTLLDHLDDYYPGGYYQMYFTQNHDENTWNGSEEALYGASADAFTVLAFTWQGLPMIYNGQEDALRQRLAFFKKDPIRWSGYARTEFFQRLCDLRHNNQALWSGRHGGPLVKIVTDADEQIYAFSRTKGEDRIIVAMNLSRVSRTFTLRPGTGVPGAYLNLFGASTVQVTQEMQLTLKPWEYLVLTNK